MTRARTVAFLGPASLLLLLDAARSQDRAAVVPEMKVLLQNDRVRVQYHDVAVGETTPMHSHPAYVAYVFNDYVGKAVLSDGTEVPLARKAGDVFYSGPVTHRIANTGKTPIHNLIVELREVLASAQDLGFTDLASIRRLARPAVRDVRRQGGIFPDTRALGPRAFSEPMQKSPLRLAKKTRDALNSTQSVADLL